MSDAPAPHFWAHLWTYLTEHFLTALNAVGIVVGLFRVSKLRVEINHRLSELIASVREGSEARGRLEGRAEGRSEERTAQERRADREAQERRDEEDRGTGQ